MAKIALAAGGTGGHLFPAAALAGELQARGHEVHLLTDARGLAYMGGFEGVDRTLIASGAVVGKGIGHKLRSLLTILWGVVQAYLRLRHLRPDVLVGFGGYPCVPPLVSAWTLGIPSLLHEQNAVMGLANRQVSRFAKQVALSFQQTKGQRHPEKAVYIGNPIRTEISAIAPKDQAGNPLNLLVFAGSQGARVMANLVPEAILGLPKALKARLHLSLQIRVEDQDRVQAMLHNIGLAGLEIHTFLDPMAPYLKRADLVIARSGATTVCEIIAAGRPALFLPLELHADAQQSVNAEGVVQAGGAEILREKETSAADLRHRLQAILEDDDTRLAMGHAAHTLATPQATKDLAHLTLNLIKKP